MGWSVFAWFVVFACACVCFVFARFVCDFLCCPMYSVCAVLCVLCALLNAFVCLICDLFV